MIIDQIITDMKLPAQHNAFFSKIALQLENAKVQLININNKCKAESQRKNVIHEFMKKRPSLLKTLKPKSSAEDHNEVDLIKSVEFFQKQHDEGLSTYTKGQLPHGNTDHAPSESEGPTTPQIKNLR